MSKAKCLICGKEFEVPRWRLGKAKYCSYPCSCKGRTSIRSYNNPRKCIGCEKEFLPTQWYQKYCTRKCFTDSVRKTTIQECPSCGKEFRQIRIGQKFCGRSCSHPYKNLAPKKPKHIHPDKIWSLEVKRRAGNKCEYCGKDHGLNSHHVFSRSNRIVRWDLDNGVCVCVLHHVFGLFSAHKSPIEFIEWLKEKRGIEWYERLRIKAREISKQSTEELTEEMKRRTKEILEARKNGLNLRFEATQGLDQVKTQVNGRSQGETAQIASKGENSGVI